MAKGKDGKKKLKAPKKIAGVKVPKEVRKAADPVLRALDNPLVADMAAAALIAAAGALTDRGKGPRTGASESRQSSAGGSLNGAFSVLASRMADKALAALDTLEDRVGLKPDHEASEAGEGKSSPRKRSTGPA